MKSWGLVQWTSARLRRGVVLSLLFVTFLCTSGRAQESSWLSEHAKETLDTISSGFTDWKLRTRRLHESNLIPEAERRQENQLLTQKANALRQQVYRYIDAYGFPGKPPIDMEAENGKIALYKQYLALPPTDSLERKALILKIMELNAPMRTRAQAQQAFLTLLNQETDFDQRCMMTPILRTEYEKETFDAYQLMLFMEQTYLILHDGEPLEFAPGTRSSHKLNTYVAELDGCW